MEYLFTDKPESLDWQTTQDLNKNDDLCIAKSDLRNHLNLPLIANGFAEDLVHAGLFFYETSSFQKLSLAALNWFFLFPQSDAQSTSWMASMHVLILKKGLLQKLDLGVQYNTTDLLAADLAFQVLRSGGWAAHRPDLVMNTDALPHHQQQIASDDLGTFILRFFGRREALLAFPFKTYSIVNSATPKIQLRKVFDHRHLLSPEKQKTIDAYSAVIPTINRYAYLKKAIYSLLQNDHPPAEVIVVDQTPEPDRIRGYYDEFSEKPVKVFFLTTAGQSTARNHAVKQATCEWILFFDDDSEAWPDMIREHCDLLEHSQADVSTGISLAPWKDRSFIPDSINFYHIASVLDTGNCMMRKRLVEEAGWFDLAFDKGSGADDNLGKRLYLRGAKIVFNPKAIRTHHKAPMGGLRTHGAWWKNKGTYFGPFPLPTESYDFLRFYPREFYTRLCLYRLVTSYRRSGFAMNMINTILFPVKVMASYRKAKTLLAMGLNR